jgi:hypothetical protein
MNKRTLKWVILLGTGSIVCQLVGTCALQVAQLAIQGLWSAFLQKLFSALTTTA